MRHRWTLLLVLGWLLLWNAPVFAQSGQLVVVDEADKLDDDDEAAIETAAAPLRDAGADVAVYFVKDGSDENDSLRRLEKYGLARDGQPIGSTVAIYVAFDPQVSEVLLGPDVPPSVASQSERIRTDVLNAGLGSGDFGTAVADTLDAIFLAGTDDNVTSAAPPATDNDGGGNLLPWVLGGVGVAGAGAGGFFFLNRRSQAQRLANARQQYEQARAAAGSAIVDVGTALQAARDQAQFDAVSYSPDDAARLATTQQQITQQFTAVQQQYDTIENTIAMKETVTPSEYIAAQQQLAPIQEQTSNIHAALQELAAERARLDEEAREGRTILQAAQRMRDDLMAQRQQAGTPPTPAAIAALIAPAVAAAEQAEQVNHLREVRHHADVAMDLMQRTSALLAKHAELSPRLAEADADIARLGNEGYRTDTARNAATRATRALQEVRDILERGGTDPAATIERAEQNIAIAEQATADALTHGRGMADLRAENEQRIASLHLHHRETLHVIEQGHKTFDVVDEFAESTWHDIAGNGSEAEESAEEAARLLAAATTANTMDTQDFVTANVYLDDAEDELERAHQLIAMIEQRLQDLQHARANARAELDAAAKDIQAGWQYVKQHDSDVGTAPEDQLREAEHLLQTATTASQQPKPDWLQVVHTAQQANELADQALAGARSEVEQMNTFRERITRQQQLTVAALTKTTNFANAHMLDIQQSNQNTLQSVGNDVTALQAQPLTDLGTTQLQQRLHEWKALEQRIEQIFSAMEGDFQRGEAQRERERAAAERQRQERLERERERQMRQMSRAMMTGAMVSSSRSRRSSSSSPSRSSSSASRSRGSWGSSSSSGTRRRGGW